MQVKHVHTSASIIFIIQLGVESNGSVSLSESQTN